MNLISTKDIVNRYDLTYQTLNFYTILGLFDVVERRGNKRMYEESQIKEKIRKIRQLKNQGYPLKLIAKKLNGDHSGKSERL